MEKRILAIVLCLVLALSCASVFVACDEPHDHTFSTEWTGDDTHHWHPATCEHTSEQGDKAEHDWVVESFDEDGHNAACSVCDAESIGEHVLDDDDVCVVCDYEKVEVLYELNGYVIWAGASIEKIVMYSNNTALLTIDRGWNEHTVKYVLNGNTLELIDNQQKMTILTVDLVENTYDYCDFDGVELLDEYDGEPNPDAGNAVLHAKLYANGYIVLAWKMDETLLVVGVYAYELQGNVIRFPHEDVKFTLTIVDDKIVMNS